MSLKQASKFLSLGMVQELMRSTECQRLLASGLSTAEAWLIQKTMLGAGKMAQWVRVFVAKLDRVHLMSHMVEGKTCLCLQVVFDTYDKQMNKCNLKTVPIWEPGIVAYTGNHSTQTGSQVLG